MKSPPNVKTKPLSLLAALAFLAALSGLMPVTRANAQATCECCPLGLPSAPNNLIDFALTWAYPPSVSDSFLTATVFANGAVAPGVYASWCADAQTALLPGIEGFDYFGSVYASSDPNLNLYLALDTANTNVLVGPDVWKEVNYLLNHRAGYNYWDVQGALWHFVGGPAVATPPYPYFNQVAVSQLISDTISNAPAWCPQLGDKVAVVVSLTWAVDNQIIIIEKPCPGTTPGIAVSVSCPTDCGLAGFSGSVTNTGNVTLTNVFVLSSQPSNNTLLLGPISLAPGAAAIFAGSYLVPCVTNLTTNTVGVVTTNSVGIITTNLVLVVTTNTVGVVTTNTVGVITTNLVFVITTNNTVTVTTNNTGTVPSNTVASAFGTISPAGSVGTVTDRFVVGTNFHGLTYSDSDHGYAATKFYSIRHDSAANANFFDTFAPTGGTGTIADRFTLPQYDFDALAYAAPDVGYGPIIFYYLRHDAGGLSTFGTITPGGVVGVVADEKVVGTNFVALTFAAPDVGYGANLFYYVRRDADCNSIFGTIDPAQGGPVTDRFTIGENVDALVFTATDVGYGADDFYYLRHDNEGNSTFGTIFVTGLTTGNVTDRFLAGTNVTELSFTPTDVLYGPNLFYYLCGMPKAGCPQITFTTNTVTSFTTNTVTSFTTNTVTSFTTNTVTSFTTNTVTSFTTNPVTSFTTNPVTSFTTNTVTSFTTNTVTSFTTNNVTSYSTNIVAAATTNTVTANGADICQGRTVTAIATCSGSGSPLVPPVIGGAGVPPPSLSNGNFSWSFTTQNGLSYTVEYKTSLSDPSWTDLQTVPGSGGIVTVSNAVAGRPAGFYRLKILP